MVTQQEKIIRISFWYLFIKLFIKIGILALLFIFFLFYFAIIGVENAFTINLAFILSTIISIILLIGDVLYWKKSGIYIANNGDHLIIFGGWFVRQDKLLNGVVIANQVTQSPIDQLLGMATIHTGIFGRRHALDGVIYSNISKYDEIMRKGMSVKATTIF